MSRKLPTPKRFEKAREKALRLGDSGRGWDVEDITSGRHPEAGMARSVREHPDAWADSTLVWESGGRVLCMRGIVDHVYSLPILVTHENLPKCLELWLKHHFVALDHCRDLPLRSDFGRTLVWEELAGSEVRAVPYPAVYFWTIHFGFRPWPNVAAAKHFTPGLIEESNGVRAVTEDTTLAIAYVQSWYLANSWRKT